MTNSNDSTLGTFLELNDRFGDAVRAGEKSERDKLLVQSAGWLHLQTLGGLAKTGEQDGDPIFEVCDAIKGLLAQRNIKNKVDAFNHCSQLVLGYVIETIAEKDAKKKARNLVDRGAKLYRAFQHFEGQIPGYEIELTDWVEANGGLDGVIKRFKEEIAGDDEDEVDEVDLTEVENALEANAITAASDEPFAADLTLAISRMTDTGEIKLMALPAVPTALIGQLAPYLPALDAKLPDEVRFWANVATLCLMHERHDSSELARPNEERHAGSSRLRSLPIVRIKSSREFAVASSRVTAGIVTHVSAKVDTVLPADVAWEHHLNGTATKMLLANMGGGVSRASFNGASYDRNTQKLSFTTRTTRIKPFSVRTLPISAFGSSRFSSQWTIDVRGFASACASRVEMEPGRLPNVLEKFAVKAAAGRHPTVVNITKGELSLAQGSEAQGISVPSSGERTASAIIASIDLYRVIRAVGDLRPTALTISIDKGGAVEFACQTRVADYRIFVPTLLDGGARSPAQFERIERPRKDAAAQSDEVEQTASALA
ncbi:hypothetical protein F1C10_00300 [Sphingomonas sp. NBWT7]|uniref:hypothetical protein n=1 Tax=Sphingomonas sp. NBWT7 TaxID=2596913 RepID=UPI001624A796|nr:hypothetical protein [Sphingomonas sp. NBWT7]QNE30581.1 hypothetical protein F1C10_00300 [Sphingomonas sp. NBWT7]